MNKADTHTWQAMPAFSLAAFAAACVAVSELMPRISGTITKAAAKRTNANCDDDDWGPVIEKKEVSTEEEGTDAD